MPDPPPPVVAQNSTTESQAPPPSREPEPVAPSVPPAAPPQTTPAASATPEPQVRELGPHDVAGAFAAGERALAEDRLVDARRIYHQLLALDLDHAQVLRVAEGLYRARDFRGALEAFGRVGALAPGEEPYRYYLAVALYETGQYDAAKATLRAVLPYIEITRDVARYRAKIERAID